MAKPQVDIIRGWKEIAEWLGVSEWTARRWRDKHGLPVRRAGMVFALREDLERWLRVAGVPIKKQK